MDAAAQKKAAVAAAFIPKPIADVASHRQIYHFFLSTTNDAGRNSSNADTFPGVN